MMLEDDGIAFVSNGDDFTSPVVNNGGGMDEGFGDTSIPPVVSGYVVGTLLGRGGFGEVRLGTHQLTNERTALKFLKKSEIISMGAAERTMTEIQCLMALKHNNIIRLFQVSHHLAFEQTPLGLTLLLFL
jgi:serine/threonine protein kinase